MLAEKLDTLAIIETPEAIDVVLRPAGVLVRSFAYIIDFLIRFAWFFVTMPIFFMLGKFGVGLLLINVFFTIWLYYVICEVRFNGASIGKKVMGLRVVNDDGTPVQFMSSLLRNILRTADVLPMFYTFGILSCTLNDKSKRLGDLVAGTLVVYADKKADRPDIEPAQPIPSPIVLTKDEQRAILAFAERSKILSFERQQELAMIVAPSLSVSPIEAVPMLLSIAQDIAGEIKFGEGSRR